MLLLCPPMETPPPSEENTDTFLGAVGENPWVVNLRLNGQSVKFCIDTGAEVTVIPEQVYQQLRSPPLLSSQRTLRGPSHNKLHTVKKEV